MVLSNDPEFVLPDSESPGMKTVSIDANTLAGTNVLAICFTPTPAWLDIANTTIMLSNSRDFMDSSWLFFLQDSTADCRLDHGSLTSEEPKHNLELQR